MDEEDREIDQRDWLGHDDGGIDPFLPATWVIKDRVRSVVVPHIILPRPLSSPLCLLFSQPAEVHLSSQLLALFLFHALSLKPLTLVSLSN